MEIHVKPDEDLEANPDTSVQNCVETFLIRGGSIQCISGKLDTNAPRDLIRLSPGDIVYPICSGGFCRSQTLWALLKDSHPQIILMPPHSARYGWDPFNGRINRYRNYSQEGVYDEFFLHFGREKAQRFGFENELEWKEIESNPSEEGLKKIRKYYDENFFNPMELADKQRVYIAFSSNAHVIIHRLIQTNDHLQNVRVIAINYDDLVTNPPSHLNVASRSVEAYAYFSSLLKDLLE